jgi:predicted HAD superfamily Cof-like phosphohydrolase
MAKKTNPQKAAPSPKKIYPSPSLLVLEFHETYGQPIRTEPIFDVPELVMRSQLILEEASEFWEANHNNDLIEMADALADLVYVCYGAALTHGINLDNSFGGTPESPAELLKSIHKKSRLKVRNAPTLAVLTRKGIASGLNKSAIAYSNYVASVDPAEGSTDQLRSILTTLVSSAYFASFSFGIDLDDVLSEVQRSNLSKLGEDGLPIYREDGKVLKGPNFFTPDIEKVLINQGWKKPKAA